MKTHLRCYLLGCLLLLGCSSDTASGTSAPSDVQFGVSDATVPSEVSSSDGGALGDGSVATPCGDGLCGVGETSENCPVDCTPVCGDGACGSGETTVTCSQDCGTVCGDGVCNGDESDGGCFQDCDDDCGDGVCKGDETTTTCPTDCGVVCGDAVCADTETTMGCPADCGALCGDGACNGGETSVSCTEDCGAICGDLSCTGNENSVNCPGDCGSDCGDGACNGGEDSVNCPEDCSADCGDGSCNGDETSVSCTQDCGADCGDGVCNGDETTATCAEDCGAVCGDGACNGDETSIICPGDCSAVCGDGACNGGENTANCTEDCGTICSDGACNGGENSANCSEDCGAVCGDGACNEDESQANCPDDCGTGCGDGVCAPVMEDCSNCAGDCPCPSGTTCVVGVCVQPSGPWCGDGLCEGDETTMTCPADCGSEGTTYSSNPYVFDLEQPVTPDEIRGGIFAHDLNGDGAMDFVITGPSVVGAYRHDGALLWKAADAINLPGAANSGTGYPGIHAPAAIAGDVDGDGAEEVAYLTTAGDLHVRDGASGDLEHTHAFPGAQALAIANLRGLGDRDAVLQYNQTELRAVTLVEGDTLWNVTNWLGLEHSPVLTVDTNGDGLDEIVGPVFLDHEGERINTWDLEANLGTSLDGLDSMAIGDIAAGGCLEIALAEQGGNNATLVASTAQVYWSQAQAPGEIEAAGECAVFKDPDKVVVGNFDTSSPGLEVFARSSCANYPWVHNSQGAIIASWKLPETAPPGWLHYEPGEDEEYGLEEMWAIDWTGGDKRHLAVKERHVEGKVAIIDAMTGAFVKVFDVEAARLYTTDVAGDHREEVIVVVPGANTGRVEIHWNDAAEGEAKPSPWGVQFYRRTQQNWNYYSTGAGSPSLEDGMGAGGPCAQVSATCGDGVCAPGEEDCTTCPGDCPCGGGTVCEAGQCVSGGGSDDCGDGACAPGVEDCGNCPGDCPCPTGTTCEDHQCVNGEQEGCGDGACAPGIEDCGTCPGDCPCPPGTSCQNQQCVSGGGEGCGDGACAPGVEDCSSCPGDCPCPDGLTCQQGACASGGGGGDWAYTDAIEAEILASAIYVRNNFPQFFGIEDLDDFSRRTKAYEMMTTVINDLRGKGVDASRCVANPGLPTSDPFHWCSDALCAGPPGEAVTIDIYQSWSDPANPQTLMTENGGQTGVVTDDLVPLQ